MYWGKIAMKDLNSEESQWQISHRCHRPSHAPARAGTVARMSGKRMFVNDAAVRKTTLTTGERQVSPAALMNSYKEFQHD